MYLVSLCCFKITLIGGKQMKIYKEKQYLIFDFEDGKNVKYDFAKKQAIGKLGKPVKDLKSQLRGLTIDELCDRCTDKQYGKFLKFVKRNCSIYTISNIGTVLDNVWKFANFEQLYSAGFEDIVDKNFSYSINDIPKALIKICKNNQIKLSNMFLNFYKEMPDAYVLAYKLEYMSLTDSQLYDMFTAYEEKRVRDDNGFCRYEKVSFFNKLIKEYGYTPKSLLIYIDHLCTFEALEDTRFVVKELCDYCSMMSRISPKYDKYPRHFLTTHKIACRNYNRLKEQFDEEDFKKQITLKMEHSFGGFEFIYPKSTQEIKDEAVMQNNCVASYIKKVINGDCHILFLRRKSEPNKSLCTIEVRNNKIVQAKLRFNDEITPELKEVVDKWNNWYKGVAA